MPQDDNPFAGQGPETVPIQDVKDIENNKPAYTLTDLFRQIYDGRGPGSMNDFRESTNVDDRRLDDGMFDQETAYQARQRVAAKLTGPFVGAPIKYRYDKRLQQDETGKFNDWIVENDGDEFRVPLGAENDPDQWKLVNTIQNMQQVNADTARSQDERAKAQDWAAQNIPNFANVGQE